MKKVTTFTDIVINLYYLDVKVFLLGLKFHRFEGTKV